MGDSFNEVNIDIEIHNDNSTVINQTIVQLQQVQHQTDQNSKSYERLKAKLQQYGKSMLAAAKATAKFAATAGAAAAAVGPLTSGILGAAKAVGAFGSSLANLTPLLAFLPSLIGSLLLIKKTVGLMGPGFSKAFEPIMANFRDAKGEASAFTKRLQGIAGIGLKPVVAEFNRLNIPAIQRGMEGIAYQLNGITNHTLRWLNTTSGQQLIANITQGTTKAMEALSPKIIRVVNAFGNLAAKAGDRAIVGLGDRIGGILDKISAWAETNDLDDINAALSDLSGYGGRLKDTFGVVRDIGRWMAENQGKVKAFSDAVAAGAIAIGLATGNIPAVIGGAFALIVNHWADLKAQFTGAKPWLSEVMTQWKTDANRIKLVEALMGALRGFRDAFLNVTKDIGPKFAGFVRELKAAWDEWAPILTAWWNTGGKQIFQMLGAAIGLLVLALLEMARKGAETTRLIAAAFKEMVRVVLDVLGGLIGGAAKAFSWVPGLGPKLAAAAAEFEAFKNSVNRALNGIDPVKTIRINAAVYVTGGGNVSGGVDQRTGNSRNAGLSSIERWRPAEQLAGLFASGAAFAMAGGNSARVAASPVELHSEHSVSVALDGQPFRQMTAKVVDESQRRTAWRTKVGKR